MVTVTAPEKAPTEHIYDEPTAHWSVLHEVTQRVDRKQFWHVTRNERIYSVLRASVPDLHSKSFLEVGCGVANVVGFMHEQGMRDATGWEINPQAIAKARARYPGISFQEHNILTETRYDAHFDIVGHFDFLEHIEDDLECLKRLKNFLKPGGYTILAVPAMPNLWSWHDEVFGHYRRYEKSVLIDRLQAAGYVDVRAWHFMSTLVPLLVLNRRFVSSVKPTTEEDLERKYRRESDLPNPVMNATLKALLRLENRIFADLDPGFGCSMLAVARRPD